MALTDPAIVANCPHSPQNIPCTLHGNSKKLFGGPYSLGKRVWCKVKEQISSFKITHDFSCVKSAVSECISLGVAERAWVVLWIHTPPLCLSFQFRHEFGVWRDLILQVSVTSLDLGSVWSSPLSVPPSTCTWLQLPSKQGWASPSTCYFQCKGESIKPDLNQFLFFVDIVLLQFLRLRSSSANWWSETNI